MGQHSKVGETTGVGAGSTDDAVGGSSPTGATDGAAPTGQTENTPDRAGPSAPPGSVPTESTRRLVARLGHRVRDATITPDMWAKAGIDNAPELALTADNPSADITGMHPTQVEYLQRHPYIRVVEVDDDRT